MKVLEVKDNNLIFGLFRKKVVPLSTIIEIQYSYSLPRTFLLRTSSKSFSLSSLFYGVLKLEDVMKLIADHNQIPIYEWPVFGYSRLSKRFDPVKVWYYPK